MALSSGSGPRSEAPTTAEITVEHRGLARHRLRWQRQSKPARHGPCKRGWGEEQHDEDGQLGRIQSRKLRRLLVYIDCEIEPKTP